MGEILCLKEKSRGRLKPIWPTLVSSPGRPYLRLLSRPEQTFTHFCGQTSLRVGEYISSFFFMTRPRRRFSRSEKNIGFIRRVKRSARLSQKKNNNKTNKMADDHAQEISDLWLFDVISYRCCDTFLRKKCSPCLNNYAQIYKRKSFFTILLSKKKKKISRLM